MLVRRGSEPCSARPRPGCSRRRLVSPRHGWAEPCTRASEYERCLERLEAAVSRGARAGTRRGAGASGMDASYVSPIDSRTRRSTRWRAMRHRRRVTGLSFGGGACCADAGRRDRTGSRTRRPRRRSTTWMYSESSRTWVGRSPARWRCPRDVLLCGYRQAGRGSDQVRFMQVIADMVAPCRPGPRDIARLTERVEPNRADRRLSLTFGPEKD